MYRRIYKANNEYLELRAGMWNYYPRMIQRKRWMKCGRVEEVARSCLEDDPWSCSIRGRLARCNDLQWCNRSVRNSIAFMVRTQWCKRLANLGHNAERRAPWTWSSRESSICVVRRARCLVSSCVQCSLIGIVFTSQFLSV